MKISRRGLFVVELSVGIKVWLNFETKLKYPVSFTKGKLREVKLVYGEAYFKVTKSFKKREQDITVLEPCLILKLIGMKQRF